jgi:hypothetical protein
MFFLLQPPKERTKEKSPQMQTFAFFCRTTSRFQGQKGSGSHHLWTAYTHLIHVYLGAPEIILNLKLDYD